MKEDEKKRSEYAATLIKPDAFRDHVARSLLRDIVSAGFNVISREFVRLIPSTAKRVYADMAESDPLKFRVAWKSLVGGRACLVIVKDGDSNEGACRKLLALRGKRHLGGLRKKYAFFPESELDRIESRQGILTLVSQNRLHVPDDDIAVANLISTLTGGQGYENELLRDLLRGGT